MKKLGILSVLACAVLLAQADDVNVLEGVSVNGENSYVSRDDIELSSPTNLYKLEQSAHTSTEIFTQKEIEAYKAKDLFDLLNKATGVDLTYHGRRSPFNVSMRGSGNITYIIDGAILPPAVSRILYKIPMIAIEEIQIIRSATSLSLAPSIGIGASNSGSGVNIGFVVIRTKQPKKTQGILSAFYEKAVSQEGANGQSLYAGTTFGDTAGLHGSIGGAISRFDRPSNDTWFDGSDGETGMVNGSLKYGGFALNLMGYKDSGRLEMQRGVTHTGTLDKSKWYYDPLKTTILSLDASMAWSENHVTLFSVGHTDYKQYEHNEYFDATPPSTRDYEEKTAAYSLRHHARFGDTSLQLGTQYTKSEGEGANQSTPFNTYETSVLGFSAGVEQRFLDGDGVVDLGYRRDQKHINDSVAAKTQIQYTNNLDANNDVDLAPASIYALGGLYRLSPNYMISARYFYGDQGTSGDFDLKTQDGSALGDEKQKRFETTFDASFSKVLGTALTYFDTRIDNEKVATSTTYIVDGAEYYYYTQQNSRTKGIELTLKGTLATNTNYRFSYTRTLEQKVSPSSFEDNVGITIPRDNISALVSHVWDATTFNASLKKVSGYTSSQSPMGWSNADLGDYLRVDANIVHTFDLGSYKADLKLYGRNLTHDQYATKYTTGYYYDRGRTIGVEATLNF